MLKYCINSILTRVRGKNISGYGGLSASQALLYLLQKGLFPAIRGLMFRLFLGSVKGILFIGKGVNILSPSKLYVGKNFFIGNFSYINCYSKSGVNIGDNVTIREFAWLQLTSSLENPGDEITIGDGTYIGPRVNLGAGASINIGCNCQFGANVSFVAENHLFNEGDKIYEQGVTRKGIKIGNDCWFGNGVIILDGVSIGDGVVIGAGAVVNKDIQEYSVAVGVPARVIRRR
ncbi:MAG: acetyltransferase-like isoleucine patch superfamily enzyme [Patiriisocius sp.]|jgi:acetyltransferase-like isoleucine patch superfamily enzyme